MIRGQDTKPRTRTYPSHTQNKPGMNLQVFLCHSSHSFPKVSFIMGSSSHTLFHVQTTIPPTSMLAIALQKGVACTSQAGNQHPTTPLGDRSNVKLPMAMSAAPVYDGCWTYLYIPEVIRVFGFASRKVKFWPNVRKADKRMAEPRRTRATEIVLRGVQVKSDGLRFDGLGQVRGLGEG